MPLLPWDSQDTGHRTTGEVPEGGEIRLLLCNTSIIPYWGEGGKYHFTCEHATSEKGRQGMLIKQGNKVKRKV